jgi:hypothetical protein
MSLCRKPVPGRQTSVRLAIACCMPIAAIVLSLGCFRYVEETRPATEADCGPVPPSKAFVRLASDSGAPGAIAGYVFDADDETGIPSRLSEAVLIVAGMRRSAKTDSLGQFRIDSIVPGRYAIQTRRIGFKPRQDSITLTKSFGQTMDIGIVRDVLDGCPGFMSIVTRKRKWKWPLTPHELQ